MSYECPHALVIAIIAILIALLLPAVQQAREAARRSQCKNNLKQMGLAMHNYNDVYGRFPPAAVYQGTGGNATADGRDANWGTTWAISILPYVEQTALYNNYNFSLTARLQVATGGQLAQRAAIPAYRCPSHQDISSRLTQDYDGFTKGTYAANGGAGSFLSLAHFNSNTYKGPFHPVAQYGASFKDILDGTSNAALISEIVAINNTADDRGAMTWVSGSLFCGLTNSSGSGAQGIATPNSKIRYDSSPYAANNTADTIINTRNDPDRNDANAGVASRSFHTGGVHTVLCDGSVRFISENLDAQTWANLLSIGDGKVLGEF